MESGRAVAIGPLQRELRVRGILRALLGLQVKNRRSSFWLGNFGFSATWVPDNGYSKVPQSFVFSFNHRFVQFFPQSICL